MVAISKDSNPNCGVNCHTICCEEKEERLSVAAKNVIHFSDFQLTVNLRLVLLQRIKAARFKF